jgi:hypothetical protein
MKKFLLFGLLVPVIYFNACKKCYHCQNTCQHCTGIGTVGHDSLGYITQVLCNDSFGTTAEYNTTIDTLIAHGFACTAAASTYSQDYCVYKDGEQPYMNYYDRGGRVPCNLK